MKEVEFEYLLPIPTAVKSALGIGKSKEHLGISYKMEVQSHANHYESYASLSRCIDKNLQLRFVVRVQIGGMHYAYPLKVLFVKTNHGSQAGAKEEAKRFEADIYTKNRPSSGAGYGAPVEPFWEVVHPETTAYRGVHTMQATVIDGNDKVLFCDIIGVHIR